ncbi:MAG TPA: hypothetical protein VHZ52_02610 [Acidobacteriaceae bacterium]|jgi:hypothetical protein|nr:hypothetical protein [Acidobacteriaceae bacterium]
MPAAALVEAVEKYLTEHPQAAVMEDGRVLFDLRSARYSVAESHGRCVLQFWSEERNVVRTVVEMRHRANSLRLMTRRMGAAKLSAIELVPGSDRRTPTAREASRRQYLKRLERVLARTFPEWKADGMRAATDLEHSFGPAYARGHLLRGTAAEAVIGVGCDESSATIDGVLTLGLLWFDYCREHSLNKRGGRHYGGLKVIVPQGAAQTTAERMVWLNHSAAAFRLFTLEERSEELIEIDFRDAGNVQTRLTHGFDAGLAMERARLGVDRVLALVPEGARPRVELRARSAAEVSLQLHGLEFARVRTNALPGAFTPENEITFGAGAHETRLDDATEPLCRELLARLFASRRPDGEYADPLFRLQPERWLESMIRTEAEEFLPGLRGEYLYSQVPAIASGERGMLDLLTLDREGRLTVIEIKADEDMHLPLQGLDYWIRVRHLNADRRPAGNREFGAFERQGYFAGAEIAPKPPKLMLIAPALRIHPSNETVLRYFSSEVEWELIAVGEHWRRELKVVFRKRCN